MCFNIVYLCPLASGHCLMLPAAAVVFKGTIVSVAQTALRVGVC